MDQIYSIIVQPKEAKFRKSFKTFGKMNPYCIVKVNNEKKQTETHHRGNKRPCWKDSLVFTIPSIDLTMTVECWSLENKNKSEFIGSTVVYLNELSRSPEISQKFTLLYHGDRIGDILIAVSLQESLYSEEIANKPVPLSENYPLPVQFPPNEYYSSAPSFHRPEQYESNYPNQELNAPQGSISAYPSSGEFVYPYLNPNPESYSPSAPPDN